MRHPGLILLFACFPWGAFAAQVQPVWSVPLGGTQLNATSQSIEDAYVLADGSAYFRSYGSGPRARIRLMPDGQVEHRQEYDNLSTTLVEHKYDTNTYLNHTSKNYRAEWDWVLGSQLHGVLLLERAEALSSFSSFAIGNLRNIQTVDTKQVLAELDVFGGWSVVGGLTETTLKNSASNFTLDSDALVLTPEIGLRYRFPSGTTITLSHRSSDGEYTSRQTPDLILLLDTGYKETENSLAVNWPVSGKSTINARVAQVERHYDNLSERNYDGTRLQIDYALKATSKITVNVAYRQDMVPYTDTRSSYYLARTLGVAPLWQITPKLALRLNLSRERRDFRGAAPGGTLRPEETVTLRGLTMDWSPIDMIRLSASHQRESRDSPNQAESFDANVSQISANLRF